MALVSQAPVEQENDSEETLNLLDMLKHVITRIDGLEILEARGCFASDEVRKSLLGATRMEGREIVALLHDRGVYLEDYADIEAFCAGVVIKAEAEDTADAE